MLKRLFTLPNTFDPDDRRRRQVLHVLLIFLVAASVIEESLGWLSECKCTPFLGAGMGVDLTLIPGVIALILLSVLLFMNRSPRFPSWLSGGILIILVMILAAQSDTPAQLYNGRSTVAWAIPILLAAVIFPPQVSFLVTAVICGMLQILTPPDSQYFNPVHYFSMMELVCIAMIAWLGMSIANRAIHDARREAANLQAIYQYVADGVLVLDLQGHFLSANPALLRMLPQEDLREIIARPLGETLLWKRRVFSVTASDVPEVGTVAIFRDETRRRETERARDALLATASHELRTPLTAVMNYLELLQVLVKSARVDSAEFGEYLARALENSNRLRHLVDDILDQAQIQAGALELKLQSFNLQALLDKVGTLLGSLIQQKQLTYEVSVASDVPQQITADPERLHQVLVNLIGNAIKFTRQGTIRVNVSTLQDDLLAIEIADTGQGIPPEQLPDIFEAFRRGSNYAQRERQGAGLGLSIAKEIVNRMGGEIRAVSAPGTGSTFTVTLPI